MWALEFCGVPYRFETYTSGVSEPLLRLRTRNFTRRMQVPILIADGVVVEGSDRIARYAARFAGDDRLGDFAQVTAWEQASDAAASEGRDRVIRRTLDSAGAQVEANNLLPAALRPHLTWLVRGVLRNLARKYAQLGPRGSMRWLLSQARAQLGDRGSLLERFSYADIVVASCLEMVEPLASSGPASREVWSWPEFALEFADLLAWRRALIAQYWPRFLLFSPAHQRPASP